MTDNLELETPLWQVAVKLYYIHRTGKHFNFNEIGKDGIAFEDRMGVLTHLLIRQIDKLIDMKLSIKKTFYR